jgi:hypothetical protein
VNVEQTAQLVMPHIAGARWQTGGMKLDDVTLTGHSEGVPTEVIVGWAKGRRSVFVRMRLYGRTYDLACWLTPPAVMERGKRFTEDAAFDATYFPSGAPATVLGHLFDAHIRPWILQARPGGIHFRSDHVEVTTSNLNDPQRVSQLFYIGRYLLGRLPGAIADAGEGAYLARGSLAEHPEVARHRQSVRIILGYALGGLVLVAIGVMGAAIVLPLWLTIITGIVSGLAWLGGLFFLATRD